VTEPDGDILLVADDGVAAELAEACPQRTFARRDDPYDALEELARGSYDAVLLAEGYPDPGGFARAVRRLGRPTRAFLLCSPAGEADLRGAGAEEFDDYFIHPPSPEDLERIFGAPTAAAPEAGAGAPAGGQPAAMTAAEVAAAVEAACSLEGLCEHLAGLVRRWTGLQARWAEAADPSETGEPLLLLDADPPRVLLADGSPELPPAAREKLASLQVLLGPLAGQVRRTEALHRLAITDHLTGAYNRRYFYHLTDQLLERARRERFRVTLLLYDIDDFKRYNDAYGHAAGDEILRETVQLMNRVTRTHDVVARIGGDEFAVLFWDAEPRRRPDSEHPQAALDVAGRFLDALKRHEFGSLGPEARGVLTISGGLATYPWDGQTCRDLLRHADRGLRQAKQSGKSTIRLVGGEPLGQ